MSKKNEGVVIGGAYKESDDHVPNPLDMTGTFNTSGTGAHHDLAAISPAIEIDKHQVAQEIVDGTADVKYQGDEAPKQEDQQSDLEDLAQRRLDTGVVVGDPGPSEALAAEEEEVSGPQAASTSGSDVGASTRLANEEKAKEAKQGTDADTSKSKAPAKKTAASQQK